MRRRLNERISRAWWAALAAVGLPHERWNGFSPGPRRAVKALLWVGVFLILVALFGVWKTSALAVAAVILLLVAPRWSHASIRGRRIGTWVAPLAVIALAASYPYYVNHMPEVPVFGPFPQLSTLVVMTIFTMMALGLNFVVGYAGLLDLGYVAFYAMGAYMAGWFASSQFAKQNVNLGAVGLYPGATGFHFCLFMAAYEHQISLKLKELRTRERRARKSTEPH